MNKINGDTIIHAALELKKYLKEEGVDIELDDFSQTNEKVFHLEEEQYRQSGTFRLLSMFSCVLLDLGILQ